jgi:hypothetical protein
MPKRKKPPEKPKDQFKRFLETAKEHEVDPKKSEGAFKDLARDPQDRRRSDSSTRRS